MSTVTIDSDILKALLKDIEMRAKILGAEYVRKTKRYDWNDEIWRRSDPHQFALVEKARRALDCQPYDFPIVSDHASRSSS